MKLTVHTPLWAQLQLLRPKTCRPPAYTMTKLPPYVKVSPVDLYGMYPMIDILFQEDVIALAKLANELGEGK